MGEGSFDEKIEIRSEVGCDDKYIVICELFGSSQQMFLFCRVRGIQTHNQPMRPPQRVSTPLFNLTFKRSSTEFIFSIIPLLNSI